MTVITEDLKIKFVQLDKFEGTFIREILTVHRGAINCSDLSLNGGYMLTGGEDNLLKIWDYDAQKTVPYYF
jgi:WD40 repeat protein